MTGRLKRGIGACIVGSMLFSSSAIAGIPARLQPANLQQPSVQYPNPWAVLTAMSGGAPAAAMCGAAAVAAAAQSPGGCVLPVMDAPLPVAAAEAPPLPLAAAPVAGAGISPLVFALIAIAASVGVLLALHSGRRANSPA